MSLRSLLHQLADEIANRLETDPLEAEYYDQDSSPLPAATHCKLVRRGYLQGFKLHGRVLVKRADMRAYIEQHKVDPIPEATDGDDAIVDSALEKLGLGGNRAA